MSEGVNISKETFSAMPMKNKLDVLFDFAQVTHQCACENNVAIVKLEKKVDKRKIFDTTVSAVTGFFGGGLTLLVWLFFGHKSHIG